MQRTENFNLGLWEGSDFPNYTMPNENMHTIDRELKNVDTKIANAIQGIGSEISAESTEREVADTELSERIDSTEQNIEILDDKYDMVLRTANDNKNHLYHNDSILNELTSNIKAIRNSSMKLYKKDGIVPMNTTDLTPIETSIGLPDWYDKSGNKFKVGVYAVTITGYVDTVPTTGLKEIPYNAVGSDFTFAFNSAGGDSPYPVAVSAIVSLTGDGSINLPYLVYSASQTLNAYDMIVEVTRIS